VIHGDRRDPDRPFNSTAIAVGVELTNEHPLLARRPLQLGVRESPTTRSNAAISSAAMKTRSNRCSD
jgi:hypothetical protein